ncbi:TonB-dependent receptor [Phenylobacterium sp.]|uniref:TonB-dependent receptor n=1 Tax=Phenylobacterium sp. TaxID=1871053 RepID=UPI0035AE2D99
MTAAVICAPSVGKAQDSTRSTQVDEVVVTATKRDETLHDTPISVSVIEGQKLAASGASEFTELDDYVPNLQISDTPAIPIITMRGIGSSTGSLSFEQAVSMYLDGVYVGRPKQFTAPFFDVKQIEVLRGPQGALVGKNTSAGAIVVVTARPTRTFEATASAEEDFEYQRTAVTGVVSGPLGESVGVRLAGRYETQNKGYLHNTVTGTDDPRPKSLVLRASADYSRDTLDLFGKLEYSYRRIEGQPFQTISRANGIVLDRTRQAGSRIGPEEDDVNNYNAVVRFDRRFGDFTLTGVTGFSAYDSEIGLDSDYYTPDIFYSRFAENFQQVSQEIRLSSPSEDRFSYIVGAYYHVADEDLTQASVPVANQAGSTRRYFSQKTKVASVFAEGTLQVSDRLRTLLGLRYTQEDKDSTYRNITGAGALSGVGVTTIAFPDSMSEGLFDPSLVVQWNVTPAVMLYASVARGSKGGAFQGSIAGAKPSTFQVGPERSRSFEAGGKFNLLDGAAFLNVNAYWTDYTGLQLTTLDPTATTLSFVTRNAGAARSRGVEVDGSWRIAAPLTLNASMAYLDSAFTDFTDGQCALQQTPDGTKPNTCNYNGVSLPYAPKWSGYASLDWRRPAAGDVDLFGSVDLRFASSARYSSVNDPVAVQSATAKLDLRIGIGAHDARWEVAVVGRNLTDEQTFSFTSSNPIANSLGGTGPDGRIQVLDPPRTVALQASARF